MESTPTPLIEEQDVITDVALTEQDKSTVAILQEDDLKNLKEAVEKIKSFKRKYNLKKIQVTDIESKEQKEKLRLAIAEVRTTKTSLEKDKKEKTLPYRSTVAYINNNYDKVIDAAESILTPLKDHKKEIDELIEAEEKKAQLMLQQRVNDRVKMLDDAGATFDGSYYSIGSEQFNIPTISLGIVDIQTTPDGIFENILQQVIEKASIIAAETEKANAEKNRLEDERIAKELEDKRLFDLQQTQLKKEQAELAAEMAEFKKQKEELRLSQEKLTQEKLDEEKRILRIDLDKKEALIKERKLQLTEIGLNNLAGNFSLMYKGLEVKVSLYTIETAIDESWIEIMNSVHITVEQQKQLFNEDKKVADQKSVADKIIADKAIADKALADKKIQDELDEKNRIEALAKAGDQSVWNDFVSRLNAIAYPEVTSKEFKDKVAKVKAYHEGLK